MEASGASIHENARTATATPTLPRPTSHRPRGGTSRWDEAAAPKRLEIQDGGVWVQKAQASSDSGGNVVRQQTASPLRRPQGKQNPAQVPPTKKSDACPICKSHEHPPARCPQAYCERCSKLGHLASVCVEFLPWECMAPMCAFQSI